MIKVKIYDFTVENSNLNNNNTLNNTEKSSLNDKIRELTQIINKFTAKEISLKNDIDNLNSKSLSKDQTIDNLLKSKDELNEEIYILKDKIKNIYSDLIKAIFEF